MKKIFRTIIFICSIYAFCGCNNIQVLDNQAQSEVVSTQIHAETTTAEPILTNSTTASKTSTKETSKPIETSKDNTTSIDSITSKSDETTATVQNATSASVNISTLEKPEIAETTENKVPTIFSDLYVGNEYFALSVTAEKIYWNDIAGFDIAENEAFDILIPIAFFDYIADSDGLLLYFDQNFLQYLDEGLTDYKQLFNNVEAMNIKNGIIYSQSFDIDNLCTIKNKKLSFIPYTDKLATQIKYYNSDNNIYLNEINEWFPDAAFNDAMIVNDLDKYFTMVREKAVKEKQSIEASEQRERENAQKNGIEVHTLREYPQYFSKVLDGARVRAKINYIY